MSTIKATTLSTQSNATVPIDTVVNGTAKAWVNFNGTGTVSIRASFNVSSITDNGVGNYTVNFTTAISDGNYCYAFGGKPSADNLAGYKTPHNVTNTTSALFVITGTATAVQDFTDVCVSVFR
jgi:ribose/xylose/arabinose/galactoside ABC-type transport system permease subunit